MHNSTNGLSLAVSSILTRALCRALRSTSSILASYEFNSHKPILASSSILASYEFNSHKQTNFRFEFNPRKLRGVEEKYRFANLVTLIIYPYLSKTYEISAETRISKMSVNIRAICLNILNHRTSIKHIKSPEKSDLLVRLKSE